MTRNIPTISRIESRFAVSAPSTDPTTLPMAIGHARPRLRWPSEAYAPVPTAEISNTVASVVPDTAAGRRLPTNNRRGAIAEPPPIPNTPPNIPPVRPIGQTMCALSALERWLVEGLPAEGPAGGHEHLSGAALWLMATVLTSESGYARS